MWRSVALSSLGLVTNLGHTGDRCSRSNRNVRRDMVAVHEDGVHPIKVFFCECPDANKPRQLILDGLWPVSWKDPATVITISVLQTFTLLANQGHLNARNFIQT